MFKVRKKKHQNNVTEVILLFLLLTLKIFQPFSSVSIIEFEQVNVSWVKDTSSSSNLLRRYNFL